MILLVGAGGWIYTRRVQRIALASYVPGSALGYFEVNDWPQVLGHLTSTETWRQMAPAYGLENKLDFIGEIGWLASLAGGGETGMLARSQVAIVITGLEVHGEEIKPRLAVIAETHSSQNDLRRTIEKRLPELARKIYGREVKETSDYGGVTITSYAKSPDRRLFSAQIGGEWILANHSDPLRACIDTRLGRAPSMANNFFLQNSQPLVARNGDLFGFITGEGVTRLLHFGAFLLSSGALRETGLLGIFQDVLSDLASRSSDGIAYGMSIEDGMAVDRYVMLFKPDLVEGLKPAIKVNRSEPKSLDYIPSNIKYATVINVENPNKTLDGIEAVISSRIGVGQSFLLHQFLLGAREVLFGMKSGGNSGPVIGNEITSLNFTKDPDDRIWLIATHNRGAMAQVIERYLAPTTRRENYSGVEIINSGSSRKGSAAFIGDFVAIGGRAQLIRLIETQRKGESFKSVIRSDAEGAMPEGAAIMSFSSVKDESIEMMGTIARWAGGSAPPRPGTLSTMQLPFATSVTSLKEQGIYIESHSPFGNLPFFVSMVDGVTADQSTRRR